MFKKNNNNKKPPGKKLLGEKNSIQLYSMFCIIKTLKKMLYCDIFFFS